MRQRVIKALAAFALLIAALVTTAVVAAATGDGSTGTTTPTNVVSPDSSGWE
jgi:ABC-type transporter Mla subunit MlaD